MRYAIPSSVTVWPAANCASLAPGAAVFAAGLGTALTGGPASSRLVPPDPTAGLGASPSRRRVPPAGVGGAMASRRLVPSGPVFGPDGSGFKRLVPEPGATPGVGVSATMFFRCLGRIIRAERRPLKVRIHLQQGHVQRRIAQVVILQRANRGLLRRGVEDEKLILRRHAQGKLIRMQTCVFDRVIACSNRL